MGAVGEVAAGLADDGFGDKRTVVGKRMEVGNYECWWTEKVMQRCCG